MRRLATGALVGAYLLYVAWLVRESFRGWRDHSVAWVRIDTGVHQ